jgi:cellulose biosynthesis protein BcsQ
MNAEPITTIVVVGNMKGGVGKSTVTSILANYIHNELPEKSVIVIDADDMQGTLDMLRNQDLLVKSYEQGVPMDQVNTDFFYDVVKVNSSNVPKQIEYLSGKVDYIFVDLPGNLKQSGVIKSYTMADHFIIPTSMSNLDLDATIKFIKEIKEKVLPAREKLGAETTLHLLLNRVKPNTNEYKEFLEMKAELEKEITILKTELPESTRISAKTNTIDTYHHVSGRDKSDVMEELCREVIEIIDNTIEA